ncbi:DUF2642 domain-containing protein [Pseudalkalibacillus sp. JSM 102089]|uniref:DUF2642 domain-containing protein n=1 Tax=Pseudalkalibacillus sp. JSM 102089 TaxID=3229856 RepID=UPI003524B381
MREIESTTPISQFCRSLYQTLISIEGRLISVQTTNGSLQGMLESVMPDHIVL